MSENLPPNNAEQPETGVPAYRAEPAPAAPMAPGGPEYVANAPVPGKTLGIVGLVLAFLISIIGLILSIVAVVQSKKAGAKNIPGVIGIVVGALGTIGWIIGLVMLIGLMGMGIDVVETCSANPEASVEVMGELVPCSSVDTSSY